MLKKANDVMLIQAIVGATLTIAWLALALIIYYNGFTLIANGVFFMSVIIANAVRVDIKKQRVGNQ